MLKSFYRLIILACSLQLLTSLALAEEIRIGIITSKTGRFAHFAKSNLNGINLAFSELPEKTRQKIKLITLDDQSSDLKANELAKDLVKEKAHLIIGPTIGSLALTVARIAKQNDIAYISSGASENALFEIPGMTSINYPDSAQAKAQAHFSIKKLKLDRALIFVEQDSYSGNLLQETFTDEFLKINGRILGGKALTYAKNQTDFSGEIRKIKRENPSVIYSPGSYIELLPFLKEARANGVHVPFLTSDAIISSKLFLEMPKGTGDLYTTLPYALEAESQNNKDFVKRYQAKYKTAPDQYAALGYDSLKVILGALKNSKNLTYEELTKNIFATKNYDGATKIKEFNTQNIPQKSIHIFKAASEKFNYHSTYNPE